ncbi:chitin biosynthesis protein [Blastomyces gilchristii SLH14081]|uniref:Chitin biosynthesis protein n=1 Tax=Blastomyces gilchristii (strain SLH14081) TaxID=559298 RepID=A0A179UTD4_BLAGS|nr:chitin biosynthesis protein [Blastomyces gilchristii SLH14081]OAT11385.1 chitin biosynthesis protein [Blastomyces gilchristii SLH14081]
MLVSLTVGKVDAGVAVLLTQDNRLIEFPSVLLPKNIASGSIVDITVSRNQAAEAASVSAFQSLQKRILHTYGIHTPSPPVLRLRNATQTSLVLEWDPINLATASLKSLSLYRNDSKAGSIPRPKEMLSTKISGLAIDTDYTFHLVLRTSAGTFSSEKLVCRTHKMTDLSGITITPGVLPQSLRTSLEEAVDRIGAKLIDTVRIDTTHFVCTEGSGAAWEKAVEMNIPVVRPEWVEGCEREGTIVSVRGYYLNADPKLRQMAPGVGAQLHRQQAMLNNASGSVSSGRLGRTNSTSRSPQQPADKELPPMPPPSSEANGPSQGQESETEDENGYGTQSSPPPPAKDGKENAQPSQEDAESPVDGKYPPPAHGDTEADYESDTAGSSNQELADKTNSQSQRKSDTSIGASGDKATNGAAGEGELDEVPL